MEVTANGEMRALTRKTNNSSNSLCKSAGDPFGKPQCTVNDDTHHYDNIPGAQANSTAGDGDGCHSEFVDFIDNMEERRQSLKSIMR